MKNSRTRTFRYLVAIFLLLGLGLAEMATAQTANPTQMCCLTASPWVMPVLSTGTGGTGVAVDQKLSRVYVVDEGPAASPGKGVVRALNYDGTTATSFGTGGAVSVAGAFGVAVGGASYPGVYVIQRDNGAGITKLDTSGVTVWSVNPSPGMGWRTLCVDDWGNVYASADSTNQLIVLDSNGNQKSPSSFGSLTSPTGLSVSGLNLYVSDTGAKRVLQFVQSGVNTYSYTQTQAVTLSDSPFGITMDLTGHFYIAFQNTGSYAAFDGNFNQLTQTCSTPSIAGAFGIALDETGAVYVAGHSSNTVAKIQACFSQTLPVYHGLNPPGSGEFFIYPSPAKGDHATVSYKMAESGRVELKVWNEKAEIVDDVTDQKSAGVQVTPFSISAFASGVYFYSLILTYDSGKVEKIKPHKFVVIH
ncbi:MAG TPA: hypothetical protein VIJ93_04385 [bacterium]